MRFKRKDALTYNEFKDPSKEYRGVPFWSWNCHIEDDKIKDQLKVFEDMGFGGAVAHSRNGLEDEYIGEKFMDGIRLSAEESKKRGLDLWLYDEDRWPSGSAGGKVTKDALHYRQKAVYFTRKAPEELSPSVGIFSRRLGAFYIELDGDGYMKSYRAAKEGEPCIYAYEMIAPDNPRYNGGANIDVLSKEAVRAFIDSTYVLYKDELGDDFGKVVSSIFTDEPQTDKKFPSEFSTFEDFDWASYPWTSDFEETYAAEYGEDIVALLPEILFELRGGRLSRARYRYHEHVAERFRQAFTKQIGDWCRENGINFTGHLLLEESLAAQSKCVGDVTRCYTDFDIPGIDVLCAKYEYTTAKQAQSIARQDGKRWIMSELYGVTGWKSDFRDYKHWGDWQAALGVTIRVPHLNWMSMLGGGKRDYPACFGYQAPWHLEFAKIEDYFARLNTVLTAGAPKVRVAVVHPVESYWLRMGPLDKTGDICMARDKAFLDFAEWLLLSGIDFDYLSEALLPTQYGDGNVGEMSYDTVIVPDCITLRESTLAVLRDMKKRGKRIIFAGAVPTLVDGDESALAKDLASDCERIAFTKEAVLDALAEERISVLLSSDGAPTHDYISHEREIDGEKWLLFVPSKHIGDKEDIKSKKRFLKVKGNYYPTVYDAMTGERYVPKSRREGGSTMIYLELCAYDSILVCLSKREVSLGGSTESRPEARSEITPRRSWSFEREEANVCLLDMAEYSFDGVNYFGEEEMLRIDTAAREKYGLPTIMGKFAYQPWAITEDEERELWLRFSFDCLGEYSCELAFERADSVTLNRVAVDMTPVGYYVDKDFTKIALPPMKQGRNLLEVKLTVTKKYGAEPMYLLGDFDVRLCGIEKTLEAPRARLGFDSVVGQGMPFYGGNIVYSREIETGDCSLEVSVGKYRGALIGVRLDGKAVGTIILPPYRVRIDGVSAGKHKIELCLFGNRHNTFGSLHCGVNDIYYGPTHWQKPDGEFIYEYQLEDMGIMKTPEIFVIEK